MILPTTAILTIVLVTMVLLLPRKYFLLPYLLTICFVPTDQRIIILDLDFTVLRILMMVGVLRILLLDPTKKIKWNRFDYTLLAWVIVGALVYIIQWRDTRAIIYKSGVIFDVIGFYWLFRKTIHSLEDVKVTVKTFAVCSLVLSVLVGLEWTSGRNPFIFLGKGVTAIRDGNYRCQASFPHSIMLGLFWATLIPVFIGFARLKSHSFLLWSAAGASAFIILTTVSSTPIMAFIAILILLCVYPWRRYTAVATWALLAFLVSLHIIMKAPVWHLIARMNIIGGSTGWHRYNLINQTVRHFSEWALIGCRSTAHWGWGLNDITNQYVLEGIRGGLVTLVLFLVILYLASKILLKLCLQQKEKKQQFLIWCLFASFVGHCIAFFGVSYFGQITVLLYLSFAIVAMIYDRAKSTGPQFKLTAAAHPE